MSKIIFNTHSIKRYSRVRKLKELKEKINAELVISNRRRKENQFD